MRHESTPRRCRPVVHPGCCQVHPHSRWSRTHPLGCGRQVFLGEVNMGTVTVADDVYGVSRKTLGCVDVGEEVIYGVRG